MGSRKQIVRVFVTVADAIIREGTSTANDLISIDDATGVIVKTESRQSGRNFETRTTAELVALTR